MDDIQTDEGLIEAYVFERHIDVRGLAAVKEGLADAGGVRFVAQFVGAFNLFARVVATDLAQLQTRIAGEYFDAGVRSDWSLNLTGSRPDAPKRRSPDICALVCVQTTTDPFDVIDQVASQLASGGSYGVAVVNAPDFDLLVDLGAESLQAVIGRVRGLRKIPGIGRTATSLADLNDNAIRPPVSS